MRTAYRSIVIIFLAGLQVLGSPKFVFGDTMSSTNFIITSDDLAAGGGNINSASYIAESDLGGKATGEDLTSTAFKACAGYPCTLSVEPPSITFSLSANQVLLGTLTPTTLSTGGVTATTTTNATYGYATTIVGDGKFRSANGGFIEDVSDGFVDIGDDEYGIGLDGSDRAFTNERSVTTTPRTIAANAAPVTGNSVVVTFAASPSVTVPAGQYRQVATFISSGKF